LPELLEPELSQAVSAHAPARTVNHRTKTDDNVTRTCIPQTFEILANITIDGSAVGVVSVGLKSPTEL
jgi:hypothetical protein